MYINNVIKILLLSTLLTGCAHIYDVSQRQRDVQVEDIQPPAPRAPKEEKSPVNHQHSDTSNNADANGNSEHGKGSEHEKGGESEKGSEQKTYNDDGKEHALAEPYESEQAKVVFMRASLAASAVKVSLYDVTGGKPFFLGEIENNSQRHQFVVPGNYIFMLVAEDTIDYMAVNAIADRTYSSIIKPKMGMWKPSFSFVPMKPANESDWYDHATVNAESYENIIVEDAQSLQMQLLNKRAVDKDVLQKHQAHWLEWQSLPHREKIARTLEIDDGR